MNPCPPPKSGISDPTYSCALTMIKNIGITQWTNKVNFKQEIVKNVLSMPETELQSDFTRNTFQGSITIDPVQYINEQVRKGEKTLWVVTLYTNQLKDIQFFVYSMHVLSLSGIFL